jgi:hypothetical protein
MQETTFEKVGAVISFTAAIVFFVFCTALK